MEISLDKLTATSFEEIAIIAFSAIGIYISIILLTRIFGKRSFSKMSSFDFAITIAIGSIIASTVLLSTVSLLNGIIGLIIIYLVQVTIAFCRRAIWFRNLIDNTPLLLMDGPNILEENMRKARVTTSELRSQLRKANVIDLSEIRAVVFETTGDISVLHTNQKDKKIVAWLLEDVKSKA